jgi:hypothetical protein
MPPCIHRSNQPLPASNRRQHLPRFVEIDGRRDLWRDLVALRHAQATPYAEQPALIRLYGLCG